MHHSPCVCLKHLMHKRKGNKKKTQTDVNRSEWIKTSAVVELCRLWPPSSPDINQNPRSQQGAEVRPCSAPPPRAPSGCTVRVDLSRCVQGSGKKSAGWKFTPIQTKDGLFYARLDPCGLCSPRGNLSPPSQRPSQKPGRREEKDGQLGSVVPSLSSLFFFNIKCMGVKKKKSST